MTDGTADYNATHYRVNLFYDLAKNAIVRMAWGLAQELGDTRTAVALTPGWLRSETMLEHHGVTEANWRDSPVPHFCISESPRFVGRAVAALATDPDVHRWTGQSLSSGQLAQVYGFTDLDGTRPDCWRYLVEVQEAGLPADDTPAIDDRGQHLPRPLVDVLVGEAQHGVARLAQRLVAARRRRAA